MLNVLLYTKGADGSLHKVRDMEVAEAYQILNLPLYKPASAVIKDDKIALEQPTIRKATFKHVGENVLGEHMYVLDSET